MKAYLCDFCLKTIGTLEGGLETFMIRGMNNACICETCVGDCNELLTKLKAKPPIHNADKE